MTVSRLYHIACSFRSARRFASTSPRKSKNSSLSETKAGGVAPSLGEKVKQGTKDVSSYGSVLAGICCAGVILYTIFRELLFGDSPTSVFSEALEKVIKDDRIVFAVGQPIKGYGETNSRGRRRHTNHMEYVKDNVNHMRMKFYIEGSQKKGTVHLEVRENDKGSYEYRYLFVDVDTYPPRTIILEDNRWNDKTAVL